MDFDTIELKWRKKVIKMKLSFSQQIILNKLQTRWALNTMNQNNVKCPVCKNTIETLKHLMTCPKRDIENKWLKLKTDLERIGTVPVLIKVIQRILHNQSLAFTMYTNQPKYTILRKMLTSQKTIGVTMIFLGYIDETWGQLQTQFSPQTDKNVWTPSLIEILIKAGLETWNRRELCVEVNQMYENFCMKILSTDAPLFKYTKEDLYKAPTETVNIWICDVKEAHERWKKHGRPNHGQRTLMEEFLQE